MINKEEFCNIIQHLSSIQEQSEKINKILNDPSYQEVRNDFASGYAFSNSRVEDDLVNVLENMFHDEQTGWIGYFIYDLECGRRWTEGMIVDPKGKDIPLSSAGELYDFLVYRDTDNFVGSTD